MEQSLGKGWFDTPHTAVRTVTSALVTASAALYLTVAIKGVLQLNAPPTQMITTTPGGQPSSADAGTSTLFGPLAVAGAMIAGLLLIWAGMRGLRNRADQRAWRRHQSVPLIAYMIGAVAYGVAHLDATPTWPGLNPLVPGALLGMLITAVTLVLPARPPEKAPEAAEPVEPQLA